MKERIIKSALALSLATLAFSFVSCTNFLMGSVKMANGTSITGLGDFFKEEEIIEQLGVSEQVFVSKGNFPDIIKLSWAPVLYADTYIIERAEVLVSADGSYSQPIEEDFKQIASIPNATNYVDRILNKATYSSEEYNYMYFYRIQAANAVNGYESGDFTDFTASNTNGLGYLFKPATGVIADKGKSIDTINISWQAVNGAKNYEIYRGTDSRGLGMEIIGETTGITHFTDTIAEADQGKEFYYGVYAKQNNGTKATISGLAIGFTLTEGSPSTPENIRVINGKGVSLSSFEVHWDAVPTSDVSKLRYNVYRNSNTDSQYKLIKKAMDGSINKYVDNDFHDQNVEYYYYIQSMTVDGDKILKSSFSGSGPETENPAFAFVLSAPTNCFSEDCEDIDSQVLRWSPSLGSNINIYTYDIYAKNNAEEEYSLLVKGISDSAENIDENGQFFAKVPRAYSYAIKCINSDGLESIFSKDFAPSPLAPINVRASRNKNTTALGNANANGVYPTVITWEIQEGENPTYVNIYRSELPNEGFKKVNTELVDAKSLSFVDASTTTKAGILYYYKVVTLNFTGYGKKSNNPAADKEQNCRGYGAITREQWFYEYNKTIRNSQLKLPHLQAKKDLDKLGTDDANGAIKGTLHYNAGTSGLGAKIIMHYESYADYYIMNDPANGIYYCLTGNTDSECKMDASGRMSGTVVVVGMYPGTTNYDDLIIKNGGAGGGIYWVETRDNEGNVILNNNSIDWTVGERK